MNANLNAPNNTAPNVNISSFVSAPMNTITNVAKNIANNAKNVANNAKNVFNNTMPSDITEPIAESLNETLKIFEPDL